MNDTNWETPVALLEGKRRVILITEECAREITDTILYHQGRIVKLENALESMMSKLINGKKKE